MPRARVKFKPPVDTPGGPFKFSVDRPDDDLRIMSAYPTEEGLLVVLEATTADPEAVIHLFDDSPMESFSEVLHADERTVLLQFELPFVPSPYHAILASRNLPQFPYTLEDGWMIADLTTSQERLSQFKAELESTGFRFEVVWVRQSVDPTALLTDCQQRFMTEAIERGYYDTPRRCSLTDLADHLAVSKSTASVVLHHQKRSFWLAARTLAFWRHRAEETIVKEFFATLVE